MQVERLGRHGARDLVGEDVRLVWRPPKAERGAQGEQGDVHAQPVGRERPGVVQAQGCVCVWGGLRARGQAVRGGWLKVVQMLSGWWCDAEWSHL